MPDPGDPWAHQRALAKTPVLGRPVSTPGPEVADTSYLCVMDREGNMFSATPSDGMLDAPVVPGLGIIVSTRGRQSWVDPNHPACVAPGKRPRLTPSPGLVMKDGRAFAPYGTPGHDVQPQAMVQMLLNIIDYGMDPQEAVEAPRVATYSFPMSVHPHPHSPGVVRAEARIPEMTIDLLGRLGHKMEPWPEWTPKAGALCTIILDPHARILTGAADPRRLAYAIGW
jgi:gamma-glutamyltranspeptidase/glutathione hydrolase